MANCVQAAAELALERGDGKRAARLLVVARTALARMGVRLQGLEGEGFIRTEDALASRLGRDRLRAIEQEAAELPLEAVIEEARALLGTERSRAQSGYSSLRHARGSSGSPFGAR